MAQETEAITLTESKRLIHLEKQIKESVFSAGEALKEIRDKKLYRADFSTFEEYCREKWGYSRQRGYQLIEAFEVVDSLPEKCQQFVDNEGQARALAAVPPPQRPAILRDIKKSGQPVTAESISVRVPPPPKKKEVYIPPDKLDEIGRKIPDALHPLWERAHELDEIISLIQSAKNSLAKGEREKDSLFVHIDFQRSIDGLAVALAEIKAARPYSLCAKCHGKLTDDCVECKGSGFIGKFFWENAVPEEKKKMILKTTKTK